CAGIGLRESCGVQPRYVVFRRSKRTGKHLIRPLRTEAIQCVIQTRRQGQVAAGEDSNNAGNSPTCRDGPHNIVGETWNLIHARQIENVPAIQIAVSFLQSQTIWSRPAWAADVEYRTVIEAMPNRIVRLYSEPRAVPSLY